MNKSLVLINNSRKYLNNSNIYEKKSDVARVLKVKHEYAKAYDTSMDFTIWEGTLSDIADLFNMSGNYKNTREFVKYLNPPRRWRVETTGTSYINGPDYEYKYFVYNGIPPEYSKRQVQEKDNVKIYKYRFYGKEIGDAKRLFPKYIIG